jgi:hypothetical protein
LPGIEEEEALTSNTRSPVNLAPSNSKQLAPRRRQWQWRKCWRCLVRVQGNFSPVACDDEIRPPTGPQGCRAPVPDASSSCGGVSLAALPQVALFPGGWAAASARRPRRSMQESLRT